MGDAAVTPQILVAHRLREAGFAHGFATRWRGDGEARVEADFGARPDRARVAASVAWLADAVGFAAPTLRQVTQVHGARVVDARALPDAAARQEADALVLHAGGAAASDARAVGVRVADCVPVLVGARAGVAAIHAGWRGVEAGVIGAAIDALGADDARGAIGPCIGACCFEVGADVAERIVAVTGDPHVVARRQGDKSFVDLRLAVRAQLTRAGVRSIEDVPGCTRCDESRFFSFRRDGERSGRHLAVIALPRS